MGGTNSSHPDPAKRKRPVWWRLLIAQTLVVVLIAVLLGRLWYLQVPMAQHYQALAAATNTQQLIVPATRGRILDSVGRPLVRNETQLVVSVDYHALRRQEDGGEAVLRRLADVLGGSYEQLRKRIRLCSPEVSRPCWPGSPYQPITVAGDVEPREALQIMEREEDFPGVSAQKHAVREYPLGTEAAQVLGYLQPATEEELREREQVRARFSGVSLVGRDGLEAAYDKRLRGVPGTRTFAVDSMGNVRGLLSEQAPQPGQHLVTSINVEVQKIVEGALKDAIERAQQQGKPTESGAAVVLDVQTGRVVSMASFPTYDPSVWNGGIDQETYAELLSEDAGNPMVSRVLQGQYPPGSTFKPTSLAAAVKAGYSTDGTYSCPGSYSVGGRSFSNYAGHAYGSMSLHKAIVVSCNTVFYRLGHEMWLDDGGTDPVANPEDAMTEMAKSFGYGRPTGIDLPFESGGRVPGREWKREYWEDTRESSCERAETGYPKVAEENPSRARYLRQVAEEHCVDGYTWRAGDAVNFAIGQGDVLVTPLQLARAYAAVANGGTLYEPRVGKAFVSADGRQVDMIEPVVAGELPIKDETLEYLQDALADVPRKGTASGAFAGFPLDQVPVAGKTGTATFLGREDSAWFASYAPADDPQFAVVVLVPQAGTGGAVSAPVAREIYEGIYGIESSENDESSAESGEEDQEAGPGPEEPVLPGGEPPDELPAVRSDGTVDAPDGYRK